METTELVTENIQEVVETVADHATETVADTAAKGYIVGDTLLCMSTPAAIVAGTMLAIGGYAYVEYVAKPIAIKVGAGIRKEMAKRKERKKQEAKKEKKK